MLLYIDDFVSIAEVQEKFNDCFPNLKIEFYTRPHLVKEASTEEDLIDPGFRLGAIRKNHTMGRLQIFSWNTVAMVEKAFQDLYGLNVQIFRMDKRGWVQTTRSDRYNLRQLSAMGEQVSNSVNPFRKLQVKENAGI